jgi:hypothetical protein
MAAGLIFILYGLRPAARAFYGVITLLTLMELEQKRDAAEAPLTTYSAPVLWIRIYFFGFKSRNFFLSFSGSDSKTNILT